MGGVAVVRAAVDVVGAAPVLDQGGAAQAEEQPVAQEAGVRIPGELGEHRAHRGQGREPGVGPPEAVVSRPDLARARAHLRRWGWQVRDESPALILLAQALDALAAAGIDTSDGLLDRYARAAADIAERDVAEVPAGSAAEAVRFVVLGTLLLEPVLLSLRRLAHEDASRRRFGGAVMPARLLRVVLSTP